MTCCPSSGVTFLPDSLVMSPSPSTPLPCCVGQGDASAAGTEPLIQDQGWAWVGAEEEGKTEAEKGEPGQNQLYSGENTGLQPQQRGRKKDPKIGDGEEN